MLCLLLLVVFRYLTECIDGVCGRPTHLVMLLVVGWASVGSGAAVRKSIRSACCL